MRLFRRHNTSRDDDRRTATALDLGCKPIRQRRGRRKLEVIFKISTNSHAIRRRTQCTDALGIFLALHKERAGIGKNVLQKRTQDKTKNSQIALVARKRAVRNTPAYKKNGNLPSPGFTQKIWPDLSLEHYHERRTHSLKRATDAERPIQRKINDGISERHAFASQRLSGLGSCRDNQRPIGVGLFQPPRESNAGKSFAYADSVNPDRACGGHRKLGKCREGKP